MNVFDRLQQAVQHAQDDNELPDYLAAKTLPLAEQPDRHQAMQGEIERLVDRLEGQAAKP